MKTGWIIIAVHVFLFCFLALLLTLSGCSSVPSQTLVIDEQIDIPLVEYSPEFQAEAAGELRSMQPACPINRPDQECSEVHTMIDDYGRLRAQIRSISDTP